VQQHIESGVVQRDSLGFIGPGLHYCNGSLVSTSRGEGAANITLKPLPILLCCAEHGIF
jgi:hypothetical protein